MSSFFKKTYSAGAADDSGLISWRHRLFLDVVAVLGGLLYASALPTLNFSFLVLLSPVLLLLVLERDNWLRGFFHGWLWAMGWTLPSYSFLREIEPGVPFAISAVASLFYGVFAMVWVLFKDEVIYPFAVYRSGSPEKESYLNKGIPWWRQNLLVILAAALFTMIEWSKSRLFPWNELSTTQYRNTLLIQIAALTGSYGISFAVFTLGAGIYTLWRFRRGYRGLVAGVVIALLVCGYGFNRLNRKLPPNTKQLKMILVQGDLSQRRHPTPGATEEALLIYSRLTAQALATYPQADIVVWPECAVPIPFCSDIDVRLYSARRFDVWFDYQYAVRSFSTPMLIGALDYAPGFDVKKPINQVTNSALYFTRDGFLAGRYDKCHRVPYGEYIPFRKFMPESVVRMIDMGRDLHPGNSHEPLRLTPDLNAGMMICFESVFSYIARASVRAGADFLLVLSNDAWYPTSCEPEQHLANALMRAVESGVPMVRCGNNGGTLVVTPTGKITQVLVVDGKEKRPELRRGRGFELVTLELPETPEETIFVRYGEYFIALCALAVVFLIGNGVAVRRKYSEYIYRKIEKK